MAFVRWLTLRMAGVGWSHVIGMFTRPLRGCGTRSSARMVEVRHECWRSQLFQRIGLGSFSSLLAFSRVSLGPHLAGECLSISMRFSGGAFPLLRCGC